METRCSRRLATGFCAFAFAAALCDAALADDKPPAAAAPAGTLEPQPRGLRSEPNIQQLVTEDDNVHVEELRVRGETKKIVVQSRLGRNGKAQTYEVLPADNGRDMSQGAAGKRDAAGQRVWNVLAF